MTRKTALNKAIYILSQIEGNEAIIEKLQDILEEIPLIHWSDKSIHDRVQQFIEEEGRNPTASDFRKKGMPPHPVFKQKYGINLSEWLEKFYPTYRPSNEELEKIYTEEFIKEYERIKPRSADDYEAKRSRNVKCWQTVRARCGLTSWRSLLSYLGLPSYSNVPREYKPMEFDVTVTTDLDDYLEKLEK